MCQDCNVKTDGTASLTATIDSLWSRLDKLVPANDHQRFCWAALAQGLKALEQGNYGIGAVIVHKRQIVVREHNRVFFPRFNSRAHAEMNAIDEAERLGYKPEDYELYGTLEWCPMCYTRTLLSGVRRAFFISEDPGNGMVFQKKHFHPDFWGQSIWAMFEGDGRTLAQADVSSQWQQLGWDMFALTREAIDAKLGAKTPDTAIVAAHVGSHA